MNKLVKIAPIVVIVTCLGSIVFALKLGMEKKALRTDLKNTQQELGTTRTELGQAQAHLKKDAELLAQAKTDLDKANTDIQSAKVALTQKTEEADTLLAKNGEMEKTLQAAKVELAASKDIIGIIQEVTQSADLHDINKIHDRLATQADENKVLSEQIVVMQQKLNEFTITPSGVRGRVSLVDNNWGFVVLDIGELQRVRKNAEFLVYRDSKLLGKVQIVSVVGNTSVGQILPGYNKLGALRVGDLAVH
jgi:hypothetical protein